MGEMGTLEFTLAPVQGFVRQARRTRDSWAGSYLLSYLAAKAMKGVLDAGTKNRICFPSIDEDELWNSINSQPENKPSKDGPEIASIPNHFTAECEDPVAAGKAGETALRAAWQKIAEDIWAEVRAVLLESEKLKTSLEELGEIKLPWVWEKQIDNLWEIYWVAGEEGVNERKNWRRHFFLEEQGEVCTVCGERVVAFGAELSRQEAREIWHGDGGIVERLNKKWNLALEEENKERLCAVCLVKRLYPHLSEKVFGWKVRTDFPSTHDFAKKSGKDAHGDPVNPYYAILLMDGDNMGKHLREHPEQRTEISKATAGFSRAVPKIVEENYQGRVVYAGGDDVLAFLPSNGALSCAAELREEFMKCQHLHGIEITISAAILFVHMMSPLRPALATAAKLLDEIAKDGIGRDAFVVQVQKRSGSPSLFAKPWVNGNPSEGAPLNWLDNLQELSKTIFPADAGEYSSGFLYKISSLLEPFTDNTNNQEMFLNENDLIAVLVAEYLRNRELSWPSEYTQERIIAEARKRMKRMYDLCKWEPRPDGKMRNKKFQTGALPLLHFLAAKGVGE